MNKLHAPTLLLFLFVLSLTSSAQNDAGNPCITPAQYAMIEKRWAENCRLYHIGSGQQRGMPTTSLGWPLKAASALTDCGFYSISAHVDHDTATGTFEDYNCGTITYDGHRGTDITIYPYKFYKMDNDLVEVVAAAAGTIADKVDGNFDKNCATNNMQGNYILIQHADGSHALYYHMKKNSITSKTVGQTVTAGEYLGIVGSSGNSSGPHLHFEVWSGSTVSTLNDPYSGTCNGLNSASWWASQKSYRDPALLKVSVNTTDIVFPACPGTEISNEASSFTIPFQGAGLPAGYAKFYIFMRNETTGMTGDLSILNPNGTTFLSWTHSSTTNYVSSFKGWSKTLPTVPGTYTFTATYNGTTCSADFDIVSSTLVAAQESASPLRVYPNPSNGKFMIEFENRPAAAMVEIYNVLGAKVTQLEISSIKSELTLDVQAGVYYYKVNDNGKFISSGKMIVE